MYKGKVIELSVFDLHKSSRDICITKLTIKDFRFIPDLSKARVVIYNNFNNGSRIIINKNGKEGLVINNDKVKRSKFYKFLYFLLI